MDSILSLRERTDILLSEHSLAVRQVKEEKKHLQEAKHKVEDSEKAQEIIQSVALKIQNTAHKKIASIVTKCLQAVFGEDSYEFQLKFSQKRGRTEAQCVLVRDGLVLEDPADEVGGGVIDVAGFALRVACLMLSQPKRRKFLALDESFRMVSKEYIPNVRGMLEMLSKEFGVQLLLITHNRDLYTGKVVELG